jgi:spore maturation protein CgeB
MFGAVPGTGRGTGRNPIDCLVVCLLKDYGKAHLDFSHEYVNLWTGLLEHPRLRARPFHVDLEAARHGVDGMRERFRALVTRDPPDLLVHQPYVAETDVPIDAVADLTRRGVPTVEWDADSSWRFDEFVRPRIGSYALFVTTHPGSVDRYRAAGANVHLSQWAVGSWYRGFPPDRPRDVPVSFAGRAHGDRRAVIASLRRAGLRVDTWGPKFGRGLLARALGRGRNHGYVPFLEVREAIGHSVVSLNLANASVAGATQQIKGRHFEIPGLGACQVTTPVEAIERYFDPGREIVVAAPGEPLVDAVRGLLADRPRARAVAEAGWRRTWAEHTWERRIDGILGALGLA